MIWPATLFKVKYTQISCKEFKEFFRNNLFFQKVPGCEFLWFQTSTILSQKHKQFFAVPNVPIFYPLKPSENKDFPKN